MRGPVALLLLAAVAAGCGAQPPQIGPTGVDGLTVPTPSLDPRDFVERIDNSYLPLVPGSTWRYRATGGETVTVTVLERTDEIQGVTATGVRDVVRDGRGRVLEDGHDWFAQDAAGNVWQLGADTTTYDGGSPGTTASWQAGRGGARAGLAMPAEPRVGDGYRREYDPGEAEDVAQVLHLDASVSVAYGDVEAVLKTEVTTPLEPGLAEHEYHARDVGLVLAQTVTGGARRMELVSFTAG
jgi:hypothetical protein